MSKVTSGKVTSRGTRAISITWAKMPLAVLLGTIAMVIYLFLGGPLPGPVGERYGSYLGALFHLMLGVDEVATLVFRSSLIFLLVFSVSWLGLTLRARQGLTRE